ncbi:MAG TPA: hypothetical protein VGN93_14920 [Shinella sp.]|jgi:endonuclease YncB( thermonuclease family)|uniref:hypothetical protein n=1 Tax=Shinella sp. TaxID=1870904 RepID=UPI002E10AE0B|nr:hypothetical protein [Shinella sp.]
MRFWMMAWLAAFLLLPFVAAATDLRPSAASDDPIWTDKPVRVDRRKQTYERLAVEHVMTPLRIAISSRVTVLDSTSFREGDRLYVLTNAVAVEAKRFCRGEGGAIAVCGQKARIALRSLIANRTLFCQQDFRIGPAAFLTCTVRGKDIAETLIAAGAAWAATPEGVATQQRAMQQKAGIWIDADCRALGRCPPVKRR